MSANDTILDAMFGRVRHYRRALRRMRAVHILNNLPAHLRKDIGWPDGDRLSGDE